MTVGELLHRLKYEDESKEVLMLKPGKKKNVPLKIDRIANWQNEDLSLDICLVIEEQKK